MISEGTRFVIDGSAPWISLLPCLVLFLTVLALNLAGDRLRQYLDIKDGE
jgi:ABC-type dipeptide/oligopeptide/nickel transport system permease subunit